MEPTFIVGDLALRRGSDAPMPEASRPDFSVLYYCQMLGRVCHVRDSLFGRWDGPEAGLYISRWAYYQHNGCPVYIETPNFASIADHIHHHAPGIQVNEIPVDTRPNAKLLRGVELQNAIQNGRIVVDLDQFSEAFKMLDAQLRAFPHQLRGHDDFRDALTLVVRTLDRIPATTSFVSSRPPDIEPLAAGDPLAYFRWKRDHPDESEGGGGLCTG